MAADVLDMLAVHLDPAELRAFLASRQDPRLPDLEDFLCALESCPDRIRHAVMFWKLATGRRIRVYTHDCKAAKYRWYEAWSG